ncbi:MAG: Nramp family divalent metal transporter [Deltaproteobacteria bacterium]|nr:Nramp family divalent metal transporter [Deltaproteobacteria bacterium]
MTSLRAFFGRLGPGFLLAAAAIGASHLVMAPQAGALYGSTFLWLVLASHVLKYPAFEFGPRYAAATGESLLAGYAHVPGPRGWALWLTLGGTVLQGIGVLAGVVIICGAVLRVHTAVLSVEAWSVIVIVVVFGLLVVGRYRWMDLLNKGMMLFLAATTLVAFVAAAPPASSYASFVVPELPEGSIALVAAMLGWMPTGIDVSIWHSMWTLEKLDLLGIPAGSGAARERMRTSLLDMRLGYGLSLVTAVMFLLIGSTLLAGRGAALKGAGFARELAEGYAGILGAWMYHAFLVTAAFAMFSTAYTVMDGFSRAFEGCVAHLRKLRAGRQPDACEERASACGPTYWGFLAVTSIIAAACIVAFPQPVRLVTFVATVTLVITPVLYGFNVWCVRHRIADPALRPPLATVALGWAGVAFMAGVAVLAVAEFVRG